MTCQNVCQAQWSQAAHLFFGESWDTEGALVGQMKRDAECGNQDSCIDCTKFEMPVIPEREIKTCKITTRQIIHFLTFSCSPLFKPTLDFINNREKLS